MVFFVCAACQESIKKPKVEAHLAKCRSCWTLTCVDCSKDFHGEEYASHTSCVSEAQKYEGALYKGPGGKVRGAIVFCVCVHVFVCVGVCE